MNRTFIQTTIVVFLCLLSSAYAQDSGNNSTQSDCGDSPGCIVAVIGASSPVILFVFLPVFVLALYLLSLAKALLARGQALCLVLRQRLRRENTKPDPEDSEAQVFCLPFSSGRYRPPGPLLDYPHPTIVLNQLDTKPGPPSSPAYPPPALPPPAYTALP